MEDEELRFGPNGGLIFCMEYLMENMEWLQRQLSGAVGEEGEVKQLKIFQLQKSSKKVRHEILQILVVADNSLALMLDYQ